VLTFGGTVSPRKTEDVTACRTPHKPIMTRNIISPNGYERNKVTTETPFQIFKEKKVQIIQGQ
jgi:hypothetical protein